jgi:hypothetical protein
LSVGVDIFVGIGGIVSLVLAIASKSDGVITAVLASWSILVAASRGPSPGTHVPRVAARLTMLSVDPAAPNA